MDLPEMDLSFAPNGDRAHTLDLQIRADLAGSLEHLATRCQGTIDFDAVGLERLIDGLRTGARYTPAAFALYSHLVFALLQDEHATAAELLHQLTRLSPQTGSCERLGLDDPRLAPHRQMMESLMQFNSIDAAALSSPDAQRLEAFFRDQQWAMQCMEHHLPELAAEIQALVTQLILVWIPDSDDRLVFDGGSSPMLWGGLFINAARRRTPLELLEVLVHESAHLLLYGFTQHEPLVLNDEAERYPSPLRVDPRPMEGIFHATWVSARMAHAMEVLSRAADLSQATRQQAQAAMQSDRSNFAAGHAVIRAHAKLTPTGRRLIDAAAISLGFPPVAEPAGPLAWRAPGPGEGHRR